MNMPGQVKVLMRFQSCYPLLRTIFAKWMPFSNICTIASVLYGGFVHNHMLFDGVSLSSLLIVAILVAVVAFFYSNLGLGGGQLYVPIMDLFFVSFLMKDIVPLSLALAFVTMISGAYSHGRKHLVHYRIGLQLAAAGLIGVAGGVIFTSSLPDVWIKAAFATMLVLVATKMLSDIYRQRKDYTSCPTEFSLRCRLTGMGASILTGFLVGSFGIGGGVVSVPLIIYVFKFEPRMAIGTSAFLGAILTPAALIAYWLNSSEGIMIHWDIALVLAPIVLVLAIVGSTWGLQKLRTNTVKTIFTCGVYLAAAEMIYSILFL